MIARLRWFGAAVLIWNLWLAGHYRIEGFPILVLTFGFAAAFELIVVRGVRSLLDASSTPAASPEPAPPPDRLRFLVPALIVAAIAAFALMVGFSERTEPTAQADVAAAPSPAPAAPVQQPQRTAPTTPLLYASIQGDRIVGTYFNRNPTTALSEITIELVPTDPSNPFTQFITQFVKAPAYALPDSMSSRFSVPIGVSVNPDLYSLRVVSPAPDAATPAATDPTAHQQVDPAYVGWTQKSTGSATFINDPFASGTGIRHYRDVTGIIWLLFPPGQRPDLEPAHPGAVQRSTTGEPPQP